MRDSRLGLLVLVVLAVGGAGLAVRSPAAERNALEPRTGAAIDDARGEGFQFAPDVNPLDQQAVIDAVTTARPPARRLIDLVEGLVTVQVGATGGRSVGRTFSSGGRFDVTLDLATVMRGYGMRGVRQLVLHELGHVVDARARHRGRGPRRPDPARLCLPSG